MPGLSRSAVRQGAESDLERPNAVRFCTFRGRGQRSGNDSICAGRLLRATVEQRFAAGTLNAYARQQQLSYYWVYQTRRDGNPWYVLINGVYPSLPQAKNAVAQSPADVQAKRPWAREIGQVKKDQNN